MSGLSEIGICIAEDETGNALPLLHEIAFLLERLARDGASATIDLGSLPMRPGDRAILEGTLGQGEVSAEIQALGATRIRETAIHGVWWVTHCNSGDEVVAEFIEVTHFPAILAAPEEDVREGLSRLREALVDTQSSHANELP